MYLAVEQCLASLYRKPLFFNTKFDIHWEAQTYVAKT